MDLSDKIDEAYDLLKKKNLSGFEIYAVHSDGMRAEAKNSLPSALVRSVESGIGIRVVSNGSMGFGYGERVTEDIVGAALTSARYQVKDEHMNIPSYVPGEYPSLDVYDPNVLKISADDCISRAESLEAAAREADSRVKNVRKASFSRSAATVRVVNSNGLDISSQVSFTGASVMVVASSGDDTQTGHDFGTSHFSDGTDIGEVGRSATANAVSLLDSREIGTCKMPVVFDNRTTATLLGFMCGAFLGENVIKNKSNLSGKIGTRCFSEVLNISERPLDPEASDGFIFDGEGMPSVNTTLVENGTPLSFLYDSYWAGVAGATTTGNCVRGGYRSVPGLGIRHLYLEPASNDIAHSLKKLKQCLKITDIMGMHTGDPISGEFSVGVRGVLMEGDTPVHPFKSAAISGNIFDILSKVKAVGNDLRCFGGISSPSMLIEEIDISSK